MADNQPWTARRLIEWTAEHFAKSGIESPRLDAEVLLGHAVGQDRMWLYLHHDDAVAADALAIYRELVKKRADRIPVAYLTGAKEFYALPFRVTPDVLIPRPDTEDLVKAALSRLVAPEYGPSQKGKMGASRRRGHCTLLPGAPPCSQHALYLLCSISTHCAKSTFGRFRRASRLPFEPARKAAG